MQGLGVPSSAGSQNRHLQTQVLLVRRSQEDCLNQGRFAKVLAIPGTSAVFSGSCSVVSAFPCFLHGSSLLELHPCSHRQGTPGLQPYVQRPPPAAQPSVGGSPSVAWAECWVGLGRHVRPPPPTWAVLPAISGAFGGDSAHWWLAKALMLPDVEGGCFVPAACLCEWQ